MFGKFFLVRKLLFFFYVSALQSSSVNAVFVTHSGEEGAGFANQIMYRQQILKEFREKYINSTLVFTAPCSSHIKGACYHSSLKFYDFFQLRSFDNCRDVVRNDKRQKLAGEYYNILTKMHIDYGDFKRSDSSAHITLRPTYCMPWRLKSTHLQSFPGVCPNISEPELPFFFEYFKIHENIKVLAQSYLQANNISTNDFIGYHYRAGDFKNHKSYRPLSYSLSYLKNFTEQNRLPHKILILSEFEEKILPENFYSVSIEVLTRLLHENNLSKYISSLAFVKLLLEFVLISMSRYFIGTHISTLSELLLNYAMIENKAGTNFSYSYIDYNMI